MATSLEAFHGCRAGLDMPPPLVLGTMNFGQRTLEPEALRVLDRALERGVTFLDTANVYVGGEGERILGRALRGRRERVLLSSKVGLMGSGAADGLLRAGPPEGLSKARVLAACDESLRQLQTDYLDVYFLHVPDPKTPIEESLDGVAELLAAGKIRAWATSNYASWQMLEMIHLCEQQGIDRPLMTQQMYNLLVRQLDIEYLAFAEKYALHTCAYNPLAGGLLTGKHRAGTPTAGSRFDNNGMYQRRYWSEHLMRTVTELGEVAKELEMSLVALSYAWLASRTGVDSVVIGPGTTAHLDEAIDAVQLQLGPDVMARLDAIYFHQQGTDARYARL